MRPQRPASLAERSPLPPGWALGLGTVTINRTGRDGQRGVLGAGAPNPTVVSLCPSVSAKGSGHRVWVQTTVGWSPPSVPGRETGFSHQLLRWRLGSLFWV